MSEAELQRRVNELESQLEAEKKAHTELKARLKKYQEQAFAVGLATLAKEHNCDLTPITQLQVTAKG